MTCTRVMQPRRGGGDSRWSQSHGQTTNTTRNLGGTKSKVSLTPGREMWRWARRRGGAGHLLRPVTKATDLHRRWRQRRSDSEVTSASLPACSCAPPLPFCCTFAPETPKKQAPGGRNGCKRKPNLVHSAQMKLRHATLMVTRRGMDRSGGGSGRGSSSIRVDAAVRSHAVGVIAQRRLVVVLVHCGAEGRGMAEGGRGNQQRPAGFKIEQPHQSLRQTCATLTINSRGGRAAAVLHHYGAVWLGGAVMMQGGSHLGGHSSQPGATLRGTQAAVPATSWSRRVRDERSSGTGGGRRHRTGLPRGSVIGPLSVVGAWSGVRWELLGVLAAGGWQAGRGETGIWL